LYDSGECCSGKHWLLVKHKCNKRKGEKKMWRKALWTPMGTVEGRCKMVLFSDLPENHMEMSPPIKK